MKLLGIAMFAFDTKAAHATRLHLQGWWSRKRAMGVSAWVLASLLVAAFVAVVSQLGLAASLIVRWVSVEGFTFKKAHVQVWEGLLSSLPILLVGVLLMALVVQITAHERRQFQKKFLADNGDTPLVRVAMKQREPGVGADHIMLALLCLIPIGSMSFDLIFPNEGIGIMPTLLWMSGALMLLGIFLLVWLISFISQNLGAIQKCAWALLRLGAPKRSIRAQFEDLPAHEKAAIAAEVNRLGADPDSEVFMRAAVTDYNQRVQNAMAQAKSLEGLTAVVAPLNEQSARSLRF